MIRDLQEYEQQKLKRLAEVEGRQSKVCPPLFFRFMLPFFHDEIFVMSCAYDFSCVLPLKFLTCCCRKLTSESAGKKMQRKKVDSPNGTSKAYI